MGDIKAIDLQYVSIAPGFNPTSPLNDIILLQKNDKFSSGAALIYWICYLQQPYCSSFAREENTRDISNTTNLLTRWRTLQSTWFQRSRNINVTTTTLHIQNSGKFLCFGVLVRKMHKLKLCLMKHFFLKIKHKLWTSISL